MNSKKEGGYVWLIVLIVIVIVIAIVWSNNKSATTETTTNTTTVSDTNTGSTVTPAATTGSNTPAPTTTTKPVAPAMTASGAYIVYYTSTGFSPKTLNLPLGKSVHFVNSSTAAMQIVPVDTTNRPYAQFSQSKAVGKGGTFDYTFTDAGSYAYYNNTQKAHTGVINAR